MSRNLSPHRDDVSALPITPALKSEICLVVSSRGSLSHGNAKLVRLTADIGRKLLLQATERRHH